MKKTLREKTRRALAMPLAAAIFVACAEGVGVGPEAESPLATQLAPGAPAAARTPAEPELGGCQNLQVPSNAKLAFRVFAIGFQIYRWNGTTWTFVAPEATLYADRGGKGAVGTHYEGPTWESSSGSTVVGTVLDRCTPSPSAIQWLLLGAVSSEGPGIFQRVTFIQRVNTVGGIAPTTSGSFTGELVKVPYTTDYYFYRQH